MEADGYFFTHYTTQVINGTIFSFSSIAGKELRILYRLTLSTLLLIIQINGNHT
jgi:hypothetical protein